jgi:hypothetical protein
MKQLFEIDPVMQRLREVNNASMLTFLRFVLSETGDR